MDPTASNYDEEANFQPDGACEYKKLPIEPIKTKQQGDIDKEKYAELKKAEEQVLLIKYEEDLKRDDSIEDPLGLFKSIEEKRAYEKYLSELKPEEQRKAQEELRRIEARAETDLERRERGRESNTRY